MRREGGDIGPSRRKWVITSAPEPFYPQEGTPDSQAFDRWLGGTQSRT
jgi:hypothetical protein